MTVAQARIHKHAEARSDTESSRALPAVNDWPTRLRRQTRSSGLGAVGKMPETPDAWVTPGAPDF